MSTLTLKAAGSQIASSCCLRWFGDGGSGGQIRVDEGNVKIRGSLSSIDHALLSMDGTEKLELQLP